jgi:hypothetical protein
MVRQWIKPEGSYLLEKLWSDVMSGELGSAWEK